MMKSGGLGLVMACLILLGGCQAKDAPPLRGGGKPQGNTAAENRSAGQPMALPTQSDDYLSFEGGVRVYPAARRMEVEARLLGGQRRPLEFLIVGPGGAAHEALFTVTAKAENIKRGLEIIGLSEAREKHVGRGYRETPKGDVVKISVIFNRSDNGKAAMVRVEDWLIDGITRASPQPGIFVFTGGSEQYLPELNRSVVSADQYGNLAAVWHDASCIIDNRHEHGAVSDVYEPNPNAPGIPPAGAAVTLVFEPDK